MSQNNNISLTVDNTVAGVDISSISDSSATAIYSGNIANGATLVASLNHGYTFNSPFSDIDNNAFVLGTSDNDGATDLYVVEKWQSRKPIDMGDGLYTSFKEDLLSQEEIQEMIYSKLEDQYPEKAIKVGLNKSITIRKYSIPIEIKMKEN